MGFRDVMAEQINFWHIKSPDPAIRRKGRILQILVVVISVASLIYSWIVPPFVNRPIFPGPIMHVMGMVVVSAVSLYLTHQGYLRTAIHLFFATLVIILGALVLLSGFFSPAFAYFMLISIVAVAVLDSAQIGLGYTAVIVTTTLLNAWMTDNWTINFILPYTITVTSIVLTTWLAANDLQTSLKETKDLAQNLQKSRNELQTGHRHIQQRARQLQLSAEISQTTSAHLDPEKLLRDTVQLIQEGFGFYYVALYLLEQNGENLRLHAATGQAGYQLWQRNFHLKVGSNSIIGWVAHNRQARISADVQQDPLYLPDPLLDNTHAEMAFPLIARDQLIGVLDVQSQASHAFQNEDITILQILANQVAINIDNARLFAQTETQLNEIEALYNLNTLLTATLDVGEIYRRAVLSLSEQLGLTHCTLYNWEPQDMSITRQIDYAIDRQTNQPEPFNLNRVTYQLNGYSHTHRVLQTLEPLLHDQHDPNLSDSKRSQLRDWQQGFCLEIPLVRGIEAIGLAELYRPENAPRFTPAEIQFSQAMANQIANALHNATLASDAQARVAQLSMLNRVSTILSMSPRLKDVFDGARREIMSLVEATGMSIILLSNQDAGVMNWVYGFEYGQEVDLSSIPPLPISQGFSGYVARHWEVLHLNRRVSELHQELQSTTVGAFPSSWLGLPLIVANQLIGVLAVENEHDNDAFNERDIELLKIIAGPLAIAVNNLIQFEEIQAALRAQSQQRLQLQTASEVAAVASSILDLDELINRAVNLIKDRFELYYVGLFLNDKEMKTAVLRAGTGEAGQLQLAHRHQLTIGGRSLIGGATGDGHSRISQDVTQDSEWRPNPALPQTRSELALPLKVRGQIIGALTVQSQTPHAFNPELIGTLQTMTDQLAVAIENAQLLARAETRTQRERRLNEISTRMYRTADVNEVIRLGLEAISEELNGSEVTLQLGHLAKTGTEV